MDLSLLNILILLAAGVGTGLVAGFAGVGGGIVMVPVMLELLRAWGVPREHVVQAAMAGADVATFPAKVFHQMVRHPLTDRGLEQFLADWAGYGGSARA